MDFELIIPILFFVIVVIANILKVIRSKATKSSEKKGPGFAGGIKTMIEGLATQIREELETASGEPKQQSSGWDQILSPAGPSQMPEQPPSQPQARPRVKPKAIKTVQKKAGVPLTLPQQKAPDQKPPEREQTEPPILGEIPVTGPKVTANELRNAVVWSEILAPPLALRNQSEQNHVWISEE